MLHGLVVRLQEEGSISDAEVSSIAERREKRLAAYVIAALKGRRLKVREAPWVTHLGSVRDWVLVRVKAFDVRTLWFVSLHGAGPPRT